MQKKLKLQRLFDVLNDTEFGLETTFGLDDWLFYKCPKPEEEYCAVYEYARESARARNLVGKIKTEFTFTQGTATFSPDEIINLPRLTASLNEKSDPVSAYLMSRFSTTAQATISQCPKISITKDAFTNILVQELNKVVCGVSIYQPNRFKAVQLSPETRDLLQRNPQGADVAQLNRLLLENAYYGILTSKQNHDASRFQIFMLDQSYEEACLLDFVIFLFISGFHRFFPTTPWLGIPADVRKKTVQGWTGEEYYREGHDPHGMTETHSRCLLDKNHPCGILPRKQYFDETGKVVKSIHVFEINWRRTPTQIVGSFKRWLDKNHDAVTEPADKRGATAWQDALHALVAYRLLKHHDKWLDALGQLVDNPFPRQKKAGEKVESVHEPLYKDQSACIRAGHKAEKFLQQFEETGWLLNAKEHPGYRELYNLLPPRHQSFVR